MAPVATGILSRQARNFSSGVRIRKQSSASCDPALARSMASAANRNIESACSDGTAVFNSWRRSRGYSIMVLPKATRLRAQTIASLTQRRIIAAARTPCESRDRLDLLHHLLEALVSFPDQIGDRALQPNLAACHRTGAQFVLETNDAIGIAAAVLQPAGQGKQRKPLGARGRAFRPRQQQCHVRVGMRAKPFVAV